MSKQASSCRLLIYKRWNKSDVADSESATSFTEEEDTATAVP